MMEDPHSGQNWRYLADASTRIWACQTYQVSCTFHGKLVRVQVFFLAGIDHELTLLNGINPKITILIMNVSGTDRQYRMDDYGSDHGQLTREQMLQLHVQTVVRGAMLRVNLKREQ